jgi:FkbM family methyltransferase
MVVDGDLLRFSSVASVMNVLGLIREILDRPLNRGRRLRALGRFTAWQLGSRIVPGPVIFPFLNGSVLAVSHGMTGATFNIYAGLQDFEDMGFMLHLLRREHLFIDVGANVGAYTVLASAVIGATSISFEPVPSTFRNLYRNVRLNDISALCELHNVGLSSQEGFLTFTADRDTTNRVVKDKVPSFQNSIKVPVTTLTSVVGKRKPALIKIDVEGFEAEVLQGGEEVLRAESLLAVIMELNGGGVEYGFEDAAVFSQVLKWGFTAYRYDPFTRDLAAIRESSRTGNTLFIRDISKVAELVGAAPKVSVLGKTF